jgi:hypothetical protein
MLSTAVAVVAGCSSDKSTSVSVAGSTTSTVSNATCLSASCHGDPALAKTIVNDQGNNETVPLYVNTTLFATSLHGNQFCVSCHTDINAAGGAHGPVDKTYGGWARFSRSQAVETIRTNEVLRTRNYYTAAARSCGTCHTAHAGFEYSAHATIFKQRAARIDANLTAIATAQEGKPTTIGEDYAAGNCNRCHTSCATCHFKSTIARKNTHSVQEYWDTIQATDKLPDNTSVPDSMSEYQMDWTANVASHEFRTKAYFATDTEGVCRTCHTGYQRPAKNAYYWTGPDHSASSTQWAKVKATNARRHSQAYELLISGSTTLSPLTGGTNTAHALMTCATCHGTAGAAYGANGNIHGLPGLPYEWALKGDVQCTDCHGSYVHVNSSVAAHIDNTFGTKVACIGCHTFGLARDFEIARNGTSDSHEVFIDPETDEVRPVVWKNGHAIAWYSHNWQTLDPGAGKTDPAGDCAKKCHYVGNLVGAGTTE